MESSAFRLRFASVNVVTWPTSTSEKGLLSHSHSVHNIAEDFSWLCLLLFSITTILCGCRTYRTPFSGRLPFRRRSSAFRHPVSEALLFSPAPVPAMNLSASARPCEMRLSLISTLTSRRKWQASNHSQERLIRATKLFAPCSSSG